MDSRPEVCQHPPTFIKAHLAGHGRDGNARTVKVPSELFDVGELKKYMTEEELAGLPGVGAGAAEEKH